MITVGSVWAGRLACSGPWSSRLGESKALSWSGSRFIGIAVVCQFLTARCTGFGVESPASYYVLRWISSRFLFRSCGYSATISFLTVASSLGVINRRIRNQCVPCVITFLFLLNCEILHRLFGKVSHARRARLQALGSITNPAQLLDAIDWILSSACSACLVARLATIVGQLF